MRIRPRRRLVKAGLTDFTSPCSTSTVLTAVLTASTPKTRGAGTTTTGTGAEAETTPPWKTEKLTPMKAPPTLVATCVLVAAKNEALVVWNVQRPEVTTQVPGAAMPSFVQSPAPETERRTLKV